MTVNKAVSVDLDIETVNENLLLNEYMAAHHAQLSGEEPVSCQ